MTAFGKLLAVLNLLVGIGIVTSAAMIYTQRPPWFDKDAGPIPPWDAPASFEQIKARLGSAESDTGEAARARTASKNWGTQYKDLQARESLRAERLGLINDRITMAKQGGPRGAFFDPTFPDGKTQSSTRDDLLVLTLSPDAVAVKGPDDRPLAGAETLLSQVHQKADEIARVAEIITQTQKEQQKISLEINEIDRRIAAQRQIRGTILAELFFLADFKENTAEQLDLLVERRDQLLSRLLGEVGSPRLIWLWHEAVTGVRPQR